MVRSRFENVPDVSATFIQHHAADLDALIDEVLRDTGPAGDYFHTMSREQVRRLLARLIPLDNGRAMLRIARLLPPAREVRTRTPPTSLARAARLRRQPSV